MVFWITAAVLTAATCLVLLRALNQGAVVGNMPRADHDRRFYEAQIAEIDRQAGIGLIGEAEMQAAKAEAARRLLASDDVAAHQAAVIGRGHLLSVMVLVPLLTLPVYLLAGSPSMPSFPLAARKADPVAAAQSGDVMSALAKVEAHLKINPNDGRGHEIIAPIYLRMGRHAEALQSFAAALKNLGPTAERLSNVGEARVYQSDGRVTPEAMQDFDAALALDPKHVKARFFLALAAQQADDKPRAVALLTALQGDLPDGELKAEIGRQIGLLTGTPAGGGEIAALPKAQQNEAIRGMVEGLAQRLATTGGSAEEWARLIRALTVLGERERVGAILGEAQQKFAAQPEALRMIEDAAKAQPQ
jgi:cytochrome c-type biogenesis protein CcmH